VFIDVNLNIRTKK